MRPAWNKTFLIVQCLLIGGLSACSTNPATGEKQFTALMPPSQEAAVGAAEHEKVEAQFGKFMTGPIATYVNEVGQRVARNTERSDVQYKFYVIDSPVVNAFAIPGGYVYVTRGLMSLANNEAELAGVLAHEIGHITGRHSAARASQGTIVGLGAAIASAVIGNSAVSQLASVGSDLYIKSYSRGQESEADTLGVRYLDRAGYDTRALATFLSSLQMETALQAKISGKDGNVPEYFSTHPLTQDRVVQANAESAKYPAGSAELNRNSYLARLDGLTYGDSPDQGFVRGNTFYHPELGLKFSVPDGCPIQNMPQQVVAQCRDGSIIAFDAVGDSQRRDPYTLLTQIWAQGKQLDNPENITVNGKRGATGGANGTVNGQSMRLQLVVVEWEPGKYYRFTMALPSGASAATVDALKRTTYSLAPLSASEASSLRPPRIKVFTASGGDTVQSIAARIPLPDYKVERIQVLNGLNPTQSLVAGQKYKTIAD